MRGWLSLYRTGRWFNVLYTCNYGPGGNYIGGQLYRAGPACSQCPPGSGCSSQHPGLCSTNTRASLGNKYQQITTTFKNNNINNNNINNINININLILRSTGASWQRTKSNGEKFLDVILSPGDKTRLELSSLISPGSSSAGEGEVCLQFLYKKYGECWCSVWEPGCSILLQQFTIYTPEHSGPNQDVREEIISKYFHALKMYHELLRMESDPIFRRWDTLYFQNAS